MTFYESNPEVAPVGDEAAEFIDPVDDTDREDDSTDGDPRARRTGEPPLQDD